MLTKFGLSNFKGFKQLDSIEIKPLTVLCGINSSGKSSIIQSLLLMKQSNVDGSKLPIDYYIQEPVVFNGLYVRLGDWVDVINNHATDKEIGFSWKLSGDFDLRDTTGFWDQRKSVQINVGVEVKLSYRENKTLNTSDNKNKLLVSKFIFKDLVTGFSLEIERFGEDKYLLKLKNVKFRDLLFRWMYCPPLYQLNRIDTRNFTETKFFKETAIDEVVFDRVQVQFDGILPMILSINEFAKQRALLSL